MSSTRIHRAHADDGTQIVGRVHGDGPPLVLVAGGPGDGEFSFDELVPLLAEGFTCYCPSTRGKGLSADHPDHAFSRLAGDVRAYVDSIGEPVTLFGHSSAGVLAIEAAAQTQSVAALAVYEPAVFERLGDDEAAQIAEAAGRMVQALDEGRGGDAGRIFYEDLALTNDDELPELAASGVFAQVARNLPAVVQEVEQSGPPRLSDPELPGRITVPVLVLCGTRSNPFFIEAARDLASSFPDGRLAEVAGATHLGPQLTPRPVADELARFAAAHRASAGALR